MSRRKVYISGPITDIPKEEYMAAFTKAEERLKEEGYLVFNPARANMMMPEWFTHDDFMEVCKPELLSCDFMYQLPGWEKSLGCIEEKGWADYYRIAIIWEDDK